VLSVLIAGAISVLSAVSYADLSAQMPAEGGTYVFAHTLLHPAAGFLSGWIFIVTNIFTGAALSLGFAHYLAALVPSVPEKPAAVTLCLLLLVINYLGLKKSALVNDGLVIAKVLILLIFIAIGFSVLNTGNFSPFAPHGATGILEGAALIFFAYTGLARITVFGEEVRDPARTIPSAMFLSLGISIALYLLVSIAAIGMAGAGTLAGSGSPLAVAIEVAGNPYAVLLVIAGGLVATSGVLLTTILAVSRVIFAMARGRELPGPLAGIDSRYRSPAPAIAVTGAAMLVSVMLADLTVAVAVSSFAYLLYYGIANAAATRLDPKTRRFPRIVSVIALVSCLALLPFLSPVSWVIGICALLSGAAVYWIMEKVRSRSSRPVMPA
jgi:APA family basic amino acid/polyamine antiporter